MAAPREPFRWRPRQVGRLPGRSVEEREDKSRRQAAALAYTRFALHGGRILPSKRGEPIQEAIRKRDSLPSAEGESNPGKQPQRAGKRPHPARARKTVSR